MKLDKELEDLTKHWKEEKERKKREGKDQEVAQMAAEIMAIFQDSDPETEEMRQEKNHE